MTKPASNAFNYIFETRVYIEPSDNTIIGAWSVPVLIKDNTLVGNDQEVIYNNNGVPGANAAFKFDGQTILLSGIQKDNNLDTLLAYDPATETWWLFADTKTLDGWVPLAGLNRLSAENR